MLDSEIYRRIQTANSLNSTARASRQMLVLASAAPPPPTSFRSYASPQGVRFAWNVVSDQKCVAYNIYRANNVRQGHVAQRIRVLRQSPDRSKGSIEFEDFTPGADEFIYWVASVNEAGTESPRVQFIPI